MLTDVYNRSIFNLQNIVLNNLAKLVKSLMALINMNKIKILNKLLIA